jgi:hypothetical protein
MLSWQLRIVTASCCNCLKSSRLLVVATAKDPKLHVIMTTVTCCCNNISPVLLLVAATADESHSFLLLPGLAAVQSASTQNVNQGEENIDRETEMGNFRHRVFFSSCNNHVLRAMKNI